MRIESQQLIFTQQSAAKIRLQPCHTVCTHLCLSELRRWAMALIEQSSHPPTATAATAAIAITPQLEAHSIKDLPDDVLELILVHVDAYSRSSHLQSAIDSCAASMLAHPPPDQPVLSPLLAPFQQLPIGRRSLLQHYLTVIIRGGLAVSTQGQNNVGVPALGGAAPPQGRNHMASHQFAAILQSQQI